MLPLPSQPDHLVHRSNTDEMVAENDCYPRDGPDYDSPYVSPGALEENPDNENLCSTVKSDVATTTSTSSSMGRTP